MRRILPMALVVSLFLVACVPQPPPQAMQVDVGDVALEITVPAGTESHDSTVSANACVDAQTVLSLPAADEQITVATTSAATACPDEEALNGRFPSWGSIEQLPQDAVAVAASPGFAATYRFALDYTECTNSCTTWTTQVALLELPEGQLVQVMGPDVDATAFDAMLATIVIVES